jgi:hypothetical protein
MHNLSLVIIGALVAFGATIGIYNKLTGNDDDVVEEVVEEFIEDELEKELGLKADSLKGKIDLTPGSPEKPAN